ncbi:methyltransferase domain-containing protein [Yinghuangia aomiensis]
MRTSGRHEWPDGRTFGTHRRKGSTACGAGTSIRSRFDSFAGDYARYSDLHDPLGEWLTEALAELAPRAAAPSTPARGSGRHAHALAATYDDIFAADLSPALVETARLLPPARAHPLRSPRPAHDIADDHGFDLVLSLATLHHVRTSTRPCGTCAVWSGPAGR